MIQEPIDTTNDYLAALHQNELVFPFSAIPRRIERERALRLAAWIVALLDQDGDFERILAAVKFT